MERVLARGGMAVVFVAWDERQGRRVALKRLRHEVAEDPGFRDRFRHEVQIHSGLDHPNVLALTDWGAGPDFFIAMELVEGGTLRTLLDRAGRLPPELALHVAGEVCRGLAFAHALGIVHRDVKPQNILISREGAVKVADFGISKTSEMTRLTMTGSVIGTPAYMSPEQAMARPLDGRSDLFSVGAMLYEMLSGTSPFQSDNPAATLRLVVEHEPSPLLELDATIPWECERIAARLLAKAPARRTATAGEAAEELDAAREEIGLRAPAETFRRFLEQPAAEWAERNRRLSRGHLHRARALYESDSSSSEAVLWEALQAALLDPSDQEAAALVRTLSESTGYRVEGAPKPRTLELEARLRAEPDDLALALQVAKSAKIDRDFPRMMRTFFRLREAPVDDPYLRSQIASLVARPAPAEAEPTRRVPAAPSAPAPLVRPARAPARARTAPPLWAVAAGIAALLAAILFLS